MPPPPAFRSNTDHRANWRRIATTVVSQARAAVQWALLPGLILSLACAPALAENKPWHGQTIRIVVGFSPGGGYDAYARLLAPHIERLSGARVVVDNQPGAGGLLALNRLARTASDELIIALANGEGAVIAQLTGRPGVAYDMTAFRVVARLADEQHVLLVRQGLGKDAAATLAAPGVLKFSAMTRPDNLGDYAAVLCAALARECRIVTGYPGSAEAARAVMTGEVDAITLSDSSGLAYARSGQASIVATIGLERSPLAADVPTLFELVKLPTERRRWLDFRLGIKSVGRVFLTAPDITPARLAAWRSLWQQLLDDPQLRAEAERQQRPIRPLDPDVVEREIHRALHALPSDERDALRHLLINEFS